jgi:hypothetical protein
MLGRLEMHRAMMPHVAGHERVVERFAQAIGGARFRRTLIAKVDDVSSNENEKPGAKRLALRARHVVEILPQFLGANERPQRAPHQLRQIVCRVKLGDRSSISAHPV